MFPIRTRKSGKNKKKRRNDQGVTHFRPSCDPHTANGKSFTIVFLHISHSTFSVRLASRDQSDAAAAPFRNSFSWSDRYCNNNLFHGSPVSVLANGKLELDCRARGCVRVCVCVFGRIYGQKRRSWQGRCEIYLWFEKVVGEKGRPNFRKLRRQFSFSERWLLWCFDDWKLLSFSSWLISKMVIDPRWNSNKSCEKKFQNNMIYRQKSCLPKPTMKKT